MALVLTRSKDERVLLKFNGLILGSVAVLKVDGRKRVSLGFDFVEEVEILREELEVDCDSP